MDLGKIARGESSVRGTRHFDVNEGFSVIPMDHDTEPDALVDSGTSHDVSLVPVSASSSGRCGQRDADNGADRSSNVQSSSGVVSSRSPRDAFSREGVSQGNALSRRSARSAKSNHRTDGSVVPVAELDSGKIARRKRGGVRASSHPYVNDASSAVPIHHVTESPAPLDGGNYWS